MIRFESVHKWFATQHVLNDVSLQIPTGTACVLSGASGAGKTTLLATVNALESIQSGRIWVGESEVSPRMKGLRQLRTQIGVVYQGYNLFGHLTAERNIRLGLEKGLGLSRAESLQRAHHHLDRVGLLEKKDAYPSELSGGQQQRVAIARCLAMRPKVVLMDEPTSALDSENASDVVSSIRALKADGITVLIATHQTALFQDLADRIVRIDAGRIVA